MIEFLWAWAWPLTTIAALCFAAFWMWIAFKLLEELKRAERLAASWQREAARLGETVAPAPPATRVSVRQIDDAALDALVAAAAAPVTDAPRVDRANFTSETAQYVVLQVRREDVLDQLRAWAAQAVTLLPLVPTTATAANQLNTLVIELQALIHRLDGNPVGEHTELPTTPEARDTGSAAVESTMPMTQTERAVDEEDDVELDIPADDDLDDDDDLVDDDSDDDSDDDDDFDEDDFDDDEDSDEDSDEDDYVDDEDDE